jgi:hypothetical protein
MWTVHKYPVILHTRFHLSWKTIKFSQGRIVVRFGRISGYLANITVQVTVPNADSSFSDQILGHQVQITATRRYQICLPINSLPFVNFKLRYSTNIMLPCEDDRICNEDNTVCKYTIIPSACKLQHALQISNPLQIFKLPASVYAALISDYVHCPLFKLPCPYCIYAYAK